jgi:hypothetical protein
MLDAFLAGAFMFAFLRDRGVGRFGSLVGGLSFQLGNNLLTAAGQGVLWKFDTACWVPLFLLFFSRVIEDRPCRVWNCLFAGAALGLQFLGGEVQLAYYVGLLAAAYFVVDAGARLYRARNRERISEALKAVGRRLLWAALCAVIAVVFAAEVFQGYASFAHGNESVAGRDEADNWRFATEFSFPPAETLSLALTNGVVPDTEVRGYVGGTIVRANDDYLGAVVVLFAVMALCSGTRRTRFWACAAVVALVISFGRYFPAPYRLIYALPAMKGFRNPHKWLFITAVCVPILAGIGADFWRSAESSKNRRIVVAIVCTVALLGLACLSPTARASGLMQLRVPLGALMLAAGLCVLGRMRRARESHVLRALFPSLIVVALAGDLALNGSRFISYYDYRPIYEKDEVVEWLRSQPGPFRVKLWAETSYLRTLVTEALPYHGIDAVDAIMSRRPPRYSDVFRAVREGRLPFERFFQLFNVRYILSAVPPQGADVAAKLAATFPANPPPGSGATCHIYEIEKFVPRAYVVDRFVMASAESVLDAIGRSDFDMGRMVVLENQPSMANGGESDSLEWSIGYDTYAPRSVAMSVTTNKQAILVLHDFMDTGWHALVDGRETEILRANYLMRAVEVPAGEHRVLFAYAPLAWGYVVTLVSWVFIIVAAVIAVCRKLPGAGRGGETT